MNKNYPNYNNKANFFHSKSGNYFACQCCGSRHIYLSHQENILKRTTSNSALSWGEIEPDGIHFEFTCKTCLHESIFRIFWDLNQEFGAYCYFGPSTKFVQSLAESKSEKREAIKPSLRFQILKRDNHQCQSCGSTVKDGAKLEIDHIIPVSKGGTNDPENLQILCKICNIGKSNKY